MLSEDIYTKAARESGATSSEAALDHKLAAYATQSKEFNGKSDLLFWMERQSQFPLLSPIALRSVSSSALHAYVERVFSVCGDLTSEKRNRMKVNLENRAFRKVNQKYYL